MAKMKLPAAPSYKRASYSGLLGCDFSVDPSLVDKKHSPDCLNMISDNGGNPIKRTGWEIVDGSYSGKIENIWSFYTNRRYIVFTANNADNTSSELVCMNESGSKYTLQNGGVQTAVGKHCAFYSNQTDDKSGFYIIDGSKYHRIYYSSGIHYQEVTPYAPLILIARNPATGGGSAYEGINLLTRERKEQFINSTSEASTSFVVSSTVNTNKSYKFEYLNSSGNWVDATEEVSSVSGATFTVTTAHTTSRNRDNIRITYYATGTDKSSYILNCTSCAHFSSTAQDQIFLTGNKNFPNNVYYSAPNDVSYFPDLNYINVGGENKILGFLNLGEYLAIVKEGTSDDSTVFLIYPTSLQTTSVSNTDGDTTTSTTTTVRTFAVKRSTAGIGAISGGAFGVLNDEPLFLSKHGVYGIISTNTTSDKIVRNRSFLLDQKLTRESSLKTAVATVWKNYYMLAVGGENYSDAEAEDGTIYQKSEGHMYILDGRHKTNNSSGNTSYGYESYYWDNIPAISITSYDEDLWFGTSLGQICRFKHTGNEGDYSDGTEYGDSNSVGKAIIARWSTPVDDDGLPEYYKTMQKKGTLCTVAPHRHSSVKVYLDVDGYGRMYIGMLYTDISGFFDGEIDFGRLSFDSRTTPRDMFFRRKQKKYQRLQIILENDAVNEPFGVFEIVKTYVVTRFAKSTASSYSSATPLEPTIFQKHTIRVELEEDDVNKSLDFNGSRWK